MRLVGDYFVLFLILLFFQGLFHQESEYQAYDRYHYCSVKEKHTEILLEICTAENEPCRGRIYGGLNSTHILCKGNFQSRIYDHWNLIFHLTPKIISRRYMHDSITFRYCILCIHSCLPSQICISTDLLFKAPSPMFRQ